MAAPNARWTNDTRQGSAFHELLVLPTLASNLARPYYTPGTPEYHAAEAARRQGAAAEGNPGISFIFVLHICVTIETGTHWYPTGGNAGLGGPAEFPPVTLAGMWSTILTIPQDSSCITVNQAYLAI